MAGEIYKVQKQEAPIDWVVEVPGSKSMTNRALLMAALADGVTTLKGVLFSEDSRNFLGSLKSLGFRVETDEQSKNGHCGGFERKASCHSRRNLCRECRHCREIPDSNACYGGGHLCGKCFRTDEKASNEAAFSSLDRVGGRACLP